MRVHANVFAMMSYACIDCIIASGSSQFFKYVANLDAFAHRN